MAQASHPAFPSLPPSSSSSRGQFPSPSTSAQVLHLLDQCTSHHAVSTLVVPLLQDTANGVPFGGASLGEKGRMALGERVLSVETENFYSLPDQEVQRLTAPLIYIVSARFNVLANAPSIYNDNLFQFAVRLSTLSDPTQLGFCPGRVSNFSWGLLRLAQKVQKVHYAIQALGTLIERSSSSHTFTGLHAAFLEACLLSKDYAAAHLVLDQLFLDVRSASPSYLDVLTYFHHAGLIYAAVQEFGKAKQCFVTATALPTHTVSAIQLAAAKRAYLCELLDTGKRLVLPKYTPGAVQRVVDRNAQAYSDLAKDYEARHWSGVKKHADQRIFDQDCNRGLVDQVVDSIVKRKILQMRKIYSRMTIDDLVLRAGSGSHHSAHVVRAVLEDMITNGDLNAAITSGTTVGSSVVSFLNDTEPASSPFGRGKLANINQIATLLEAELVEASRRAGLHKDYLKKQASLLENAGKTGGGGRIGKMDDFDQMMAAEELPARPRKGVGANYNDMGF